MCVIVICTDKKLDEATIEACQSANSQGFGIAWEKDKKIHWKKGMFKVEDIKKIIAETTLPFVAHFRIATVGGPCQELCQPFPIEPPVSVEAEGSAKRVVFHNGHVSMWEELVRSTAIRSGKPIPESNWSDTRAIAYALTYADKSLLGWLSGRYAIMEVGEVTRYWGDWEKIDGILFSNKDWENRKWRRDRKETFSSPHHKPYFGTGYYPSSTDYASGRWDAKLSKWVYDDEEYSNYNTKTNNLWGLSGSLPAVTDATTNSIVSSEDEKPEEITEYDLASCPDDGAPLLTAEYAKEYGMIELPDSLAKEFRVYMMHYPWIYRDANDDTKKGWVNIKELSKLEMKTINAAIMRERIADQADYYTATLEEEIGGEA